MDYEAYKANELSIYTGHFSKTHSQGIMDFADQLFPDYIFTRKEKKQQYGYCTACKKEFKTEGLRHKEQVICPRCSETVIVQSEAMGRKYMVNEAYFIYYEKSIIDLNVIVARGVYAVEDYRGPNYKKVSPQMTDRTLYVFKVGESVMLKRYSWYSRNEGQFASHYAGFKHFEKATTVHSELSVWARNNAERGIAAYSRDSIATAVLGTPFQYSTWGEYRHEPMVTFFDLYSKYPLAVEYLTKLGFASLIDAKLMGDNTCGAVNWKGKTVFKMLRVNRKDLKVLREAENCYSPLFIRLYQINKSDNEGMTLDELAEVERNFGTNQMRDIDAIRKYSTLKKAFNYLKKQQNTCKSRGRTPHFSSILQVVIAYRDYLKDCSTLEMDMRDERVLFPKNLYTAHQNTITQVKVKESEILNEQISKRLPALSQKFSFEANGLIIRPARDSKELINEGKTLSHCVGTYAERYASGKTNILLIRKTSDPDKPYYTMEINNDNTIIQTRGLRNCGMNNEVQAFVNAFIAQVMQKEKKSKTKVPA